MVWTTNLELAVTSCLGSVPEAVNRTAGTLPTLRDLFWGDGDAAPWAVAHRRALAGELASFEYKHGDRTYSARVGPKIRHSTGRLAGTIGAAHDITEYKRLDQAKNDFISTVSHELRTPVTSIHGSLRLLATRLSPAVPVDARTLVELAARNSEILARLVGDIVDLQKIESGRLVLVPGPVDLGDLARQAVELNRPYGQHFGVSYDLVQAPPGLVVRADPDRLRQVAANLLSNAAKFSPQGAQVRIAVEERDGHARMSVLNFGPPISEQYRTRIFEKFGTVDSSDSRLRGGTGLGLSISRSIIMQHGGLLDYTSDPERGTEFYFELPLADAPAP